MTAYKKPHGYTTSGAPMQKTQRVKDTLVPSRGLMALVNSDESFVLARTRLGLYPQKLYTMIQEVGLERVKRVTDFFLSIHMAAPSFFYCSKEGEYNSHPEAVKERARKQLITVALTLSKRIEEKYAGPYYWDRWGEGKGGQN